MPDGLELCAIYSSDGIALKIFKNLRTEKIAIVMHPEYSTPELEVMNSLVISMTPQSAIFLGDILKVRGESMEASHDSAPR